MVRRRKQPISVSYHAVAFIDIMGQTAKLRNISSFPSPNNSKENDEFLNNIRETYGAVVRVRNFIKDQFSVHKNFKPNLSSYPKKLRDQAKNLKSQPVKIHQFSDFTVAYVHFSHDREYEVPVLGVMSLISCIAITSLYSLADGHPIRGGIDLGLNINISSKEIYGKALSNAYTLESKLANYPRVIIGKELLNFLKKSTKAQSKADDIKTIFSVDTAKKCLSYLKTDYDGQVFIDYLQLSYEILHADENETDAYANEIINKAYAFICTSLEKHQNEKNSKLASKYKLLKDYFDSKLATWGVQKI